MNNNTPPTLNIRHEFRESGRRKFHRLIVDEQESKWVNAAYEFAVVRPLNGPSGFAASHDNCAELPEVFSFTTLYAKEILPSKVEPVSDEELPSE